MVTFWDHVEVELEAGKGGDGLISMRSEKGAPKGGPDGGDGGDGGSVVLLADRGVSTLAEFARKRRFTAKPGGPGGRAKKHGKSADNLVLKVPVGTVIRSDERLLADLVEEGMDAVAARGGIGGFGNAHFTSSRRQTPRLAEKGEPGERRSITLELKLVADIGLVGIPSVGKSTLLSRLTAAKPKIADYPFTTTVPQLGIAEVSGRRVSIADIPGLIEGAHEGKGLGDAFLRHIDRTRALIHLVDATSDEPASELRQVEAELKAHDAKLLKKSRIIALNKSDAITKGETAEKVRKLEHATKLPVFAISAASGNGLEALLHAAAEVAAVPAEPVETAVPRLTIADLAPDSLAVERRGDGEGYIVRGARLERLAAQTDFSNPQAAERFWWTARRLGLDARLEKLGAVPNAALSIGPASLRWPGGLT